MTRLRSSASTSTLCARSCCRQLAALVTAKAPGAWKRWPSVRSPLTRPCPSSEPSRRSNGTMAPSSRQMMRRSGRTQTKLRRAAPAHGFGPRKAAEHAWALPPRSAQRRTRRQADYIQHPIVAFRRGVARVSRHCACEESLTAPALERWRAGREPEVAGRAARASKTSARSAMSAGAKVCADGGKWRKQLLENGGRSHARSSAAALALHAGGDFLAEQFQKEFGHVQSFSAGSMSVWAKSLPMKSNGSLVILASA